MISPMDEHARRVMAAVLDALSPFDSVSVSVAEIQSAVAAAAQALDNGRLLDRGALVTGVLDQPLCLGTTRRGEPRHPLYVAQATEVIPYATTDQNIRGV